MKTTSLKRNLFLGLCIVSAGAFTACSSSDNNTDTPEIDGEKVNKPFMISVSGSGESEYLMQLEQIETGKHKISENVSQLEQSGYTWIYSPDHKHMLGLLYKKGDPGICLGYHLDNKGKLIKPTQFQIVSRYTSYGFVGDRVITTVGGANIEGSEIPEGIIFNTVDLNNNYALTTHKPMRTNGVFKENEIANFSGIVDTGKGTFLTGVVVSEPKGINATGGSGTGKVTDPDRVWVAELDNDFNIVNKIEDERLSYSSGRYRSQYYSQIGKTDDGTVYVFSGSYESETTKPAGALKLAPNYKSFDKEYYFNIQEQSKFKFRKVWYITEHYFLLELYNLEQIETLTPATQYAIVDMKTKSYRKLEGIPAMNDIVNTGLPYAYEGQLLFPITGKGQDPAIYIINAKTATAKKGVTISGTPGITAIGYIK